MKRMFIFAAGMLLIAACGTAGASTPTAHAERDAAIHEAAGQGVEVEATTTTTTMPTTTTTQATTTTTAPTTTTTQEIHRGSDGPLDSGTAPSLEGGNLPGSNFSEGEWMVLAIMATDAEYAMFCDYADTLYVDQMATSVHDGFNSGGTGYTMSEVDSIVFVAYAITIHCPEKSEMVVGEVFSRYPSSVSAEAYALVQILDDLSDEWAG